jgi:putative RecB family exonuclease
MTMTPDDDINPVKVAEPLGGRDYLNNSAVRLYQACPLRYHFKHIAGLPEATVGSSLVLDEAFQACLQVHFECLRTEGRPPDLDTLLHVFWTAWHAHDGLTIVFNQGQDLASVARLAERLLLGFRASDLARPVGLILGVAEELRGAIVAGCPDLLARIDPLIDTGPELVLTDFRTSRSAWNAERVEEAAPELLISHELAKPRAGGRPIRIEFAVVTKAKFPVLTRHEVQVDPHQVERAKVLVQRIWRGIEAGHVYPVPSPLNCTRCPFRDPCRAWPGPGSAGLSHAEISAATARKAQPLRQRSLDP